MRIPNITQIVVKLLRTPGCKRVTKYLSPTETAKATYRGKRDRRDRTQHVVVTIGRPNFRERKFIKLCRKACEPFPVKKLQLHIPRVA